MREKQNKKSKARKVRQEKQGKKCNARKARQEKQDKQASNNMIEKARRQKTPAKTREQHVQESAKQHRLANMSNLATTKK